MAFSVFLHLAVCRCIWLYISLSINLFLFSICLLPYASFLLSMSVSVCLFLSLSLLISSCHHSTIQKTPQCAIDINPGVGGVANNQNFGLGAWGFARRSVGEGGRKRVVKCYYNVFNKGVMFESGEKQACRSRHKWSILSRSFQKV